MTIKKYKLALHRLIEGKPKLWIDRFERPRPLLDVLKEMETLQRDKHIQQTSKHNNFT